MSDINFKLLYSLPTQNDINISNELDNRMVQFYINSFRQSNEIGSLIQSDYSDISWEYSPSLLTSQDIIDIGVKTFPQVGSYGFYTTRYEETSRIVFPIFNPEDTLYDAPTLIISEESPTEIRVTISDPNNVKFECYRIVFRNGFFSDEYITYDKELVITKPIATSVSLFGYIEERLASKEFRYDYIY